MCCIISRDRVSGWSNKKRGKERKKLRKNREGDRGRRGEGGTRKKNKVRGEQEVARVKRKAPVARPRRAKRAEWSSRPSGRNFPGAARAILFRGETERKRKRDGEREKGRRERGIFYFVRGSNCQPVFRGGKIKYKGYAHRCTVRCMCIRTARDDDAARATTVGPPISLRSVADLAYMGP